MIFGDNIRESFGYNFRLICFLCWVALTFLFVLTSALFLTGRIFISCQVDSAILFVRWTLGSPFYFVHSDHDAFDLFVCHIENLALFSWHPFNELLFDTFVKLVSFSSFEACFKHFCMGAFHGKFRFCMKLARLFFVVVLGLIYLALFFLFFGRFSFIINFVLFGCIDFDFLGFNCLNSLFISFFFISLFYFILNLLIFIFFSLSFVVLGLFTLQLIVLDFFAYNCLIVNSCQTRG